MRFCCTKGSGNVFFLALALALALATPALAQYGKGPDLTATPSGDPAIAAAYVATALKAIDDGDFAQAEVILARGADFAEASSDISYLLALTRAALSRPIPEILEPLEKARSTGRWQRYSPDSARIVEAGVLVRLHSFDGALDLLASLPLSPDASYLGLLALASRGGSSAYLSALSRALDAWPNDIRFVRILFSEAARRRPSPGEQSLVDLALKRLPVLLDQDPSLAALAVPFLRDTEEARRLVAAWRANGHAGPASLKPALSLGLISDEVAIAELFASPRNPVSVETLRDIWALLRSDATRELFLGNLAAFSGTLVQDADGDRFPEAVVCYAAGKIVLASFDADQDGIPELVVSCIEGNPVRADTAVYRDAPGAIGDLQTRYAAKPDTAAVEWFRYPQVASVRFDQLTWEMAPAAFSFSPVSLDRLVPSPSGPVIRFPRIELSALALSERTLVSFASAVERPGTVAKGSLERVEIASGLPLRSVETLDGRTVATRQYRNGKLVVRHLDLDLDGRLETTDRFSPLPTDPSWLVAEGTPSLRECDWDGDGLAEYAERLLGNGTIERSWDMDHDGKRERKEIGN